jgi:hypothetical protein
MKTTLELSPMLAGGKTRFATIFHPCTDGELIEDFAMAPALGARLPDDIPLPVGPSEVEFHFSTGPGDVMPMTVVSVVINGEMAFHWFLDITDPVAWGVIDAWDAQGGFQVHVYHEGSEMTHLLTLGLEDGVSLSDSLRDLRSFCGQALTAEFYADADVMCRDGAIELPFLLSNPGLKRQSSWILAIPNVMAYLEGVPTREIGVTPSMELGTCRVVEEVDLNGGRLAEAVRMESTT